MISITAVVSVVAVLVLCLVMSRRQVLRLRQTVAERDEELAAARTHQATAAAIIGRAQADAAAPEAEMPNPRRPWYLKPVRNSINALAGVFTGAAAASNRFRSRLVPTAAVAGASVLTAVVGWLVIYDQPNHGGRALMPPNPPSASSPPLDGEDTKDSTQSVREVTDDTPVTSTPPAPPPPSAQPSPAPSSDQDTPEQQPPTELPPAAPQAPEPSTQQPAPPARSAEPAQPAEPSTPVAPPAGRDGGGQGKEKPPPEEDTRRCINVVISAVCVQPLDETIDELTEDE